MSARAARRMMQPVLDEENVSDESDDGGTTMNAFSMLEKKKKKKKKNKGPPKEDKEPPAEVQDEATPPTRESTTEREKPEKNEQPKKQNKKKEKKQQKKKEEKEEDIDALLNQFAHTRSDGTVSSEPVLPKGDSPRDKLLAMLECTAPCFNRHTELRRMFGKAAKESIKPKKATYHGKPVVFRKSMFVPQEDIVEWPPYNSHGLHMEKSKDVIYDKDGNPQQVYEVVADQDQERANMMFQQALMSHNPRAYGPVLQRFPYHLPTLLQMSEVLHTFGEHQQANDNIKVSLYAVDMISRPCGLDWCNTVSTVTSTNSSDSTSSPPRSGTAKSQPATVHNVHRILPYSNPANRTVLTILKKHLLGLDRNGCYRTALEFTKLLFSLDLDDALYTLLVVDHLALRSGQYQWLLDFVSCLEQCGDDRYQLPNLQYSCALAHQFLAMEAEAAPTTTSTKGSTQASTEDTAAMVEKHTQASLEQLQRAVLMYPQAVVALLQKLEVMSESVLSHSLFSTPCTVNKIVRLFDLWVDKQHETWKPGQIQSWVQLGISKALATITEQPDEKTRWENTRNTLYNECTIFDHYSAAVKPDMFNDVAGGMPAEEMMRMMGDPGQGDPWEQAQQMQPDIDPAVLGDQNALMLFLQSMLPWNTVQNMARNVQGGGGDGEPDEDAGG